MTLTEDTIGDYAETLVLQVKGGGRELDYSAASLTTLEELLRVSDELLQTPDFPDAQRNIVIFYNGCYLGEVIARTLSASWRFDAANWFESSLVIPFGDGGLQVKPFEKLYRRVTDGPDNNDLVSYYAGITAKLKEQHAL